MPNRSMTERISVANQIDGAQTATVTPSAGVDLLNAHRAEIVGYIGTMANAANSPQPSWTFTVVHSDTDGSYAACSADDLVAGSSNVSISSNTFLVVDAAAEDDAVFNVGYVGNKRYIKVVATAANTPGSTDISVLVVRELKLVA